MSGNFRNALSGEDSPGQEIATTAVREQNVLPVLADLRYQADLQRLQKWHERQPRRREPMDVFAKLDQAVVTTEPFSHVVLPDAIDPSVCDELLRTMPSLQRLSKGRPLGSNCQYLMRSHEVLESSVVGEVWQMMIRAGLSPQFLRRVLRLFAPHITRIYPDFEQRFGPLAELSGVPRALPRGSRGVVGVDAQIGVNTPPLVDGTSARGPHLDKPNKLFVGLLYLRPDGDGSTGGELQLSVPTQPVTSCGPSYSLPPERVRVERTIPYRRNTLVLMLNTPQSWHGVSPRAVTPYPRYYLNLVNELSEPLFDLRIDETVTSGDSLHGQKSSFGSWLERLLVRRRRSSAVPQESKR
jgi:hypothetical protein